MTTEPFRPSVGMLVVAALALGGTVLAAVGGTAGWGLDPPVREPLSVREGSMRRGPSGTRFFVSGGRSMRGGGLHGGK